MTALGAPWERGQGLFLRAPVFYHGGPVAALDAAHASWAAVLSTKTPDELVRAIARRRPVVLWEGPEAWSPGRWRATRAALSERARRLALPGYIADVETGWSRADAAELGELVAELSADARTLAVAVTSYPAHSVWRAMAGRPLTPMPQLYGVRDPSQTATDRARWLATVERWTGRPAIPARAAWGRSDDAELASYVREYRGPAAWWHTAWNARAVATVRSAAELGAPYALAVVALVLVVGAFTLWRVTA